MGRSPTPAACHEYVGANNKVHERKHLSSDSRFLGPSGGGGGGGH